MATPTTTIRFTFGDHVIIRRIKKRTGVLAQTEAIRVALRFWDLNNPEEKRRK